MYLDPAVEALQGLVFNPVQRREEGTFLAIDIERDQLLDAISERLANQTGKRGISDAASCVGNGRTHSPRSHCHLRVLLEEEKGGLVDNLWTVAKPTYDDDALFTDICQCII